MHCIIEQINFSNKILIGPDMQISFQASPTSGQFSPHLGRIQTFETPYKKSIQQTAQKTLKKAILDKLEAGKYNTASSKKLKRSLLPKQAKEEDKVTDDQDNINKEKEFILRNQSQTHPGFYEYVHWLKLHAESFAYVDRKYVDELWKILRLINYGEVFLPTGLVYELFMEVKRNIQIGGFSKIINQFLKENETSDSLKTFKDIKNYIDIKQIEKAYKCSLDQEKSGQNDASHKKSRSHSAFNVFERNFQEAKVRTDKKIAKICTNLIKESQSLSQKPKISVYRSESYQSLVKPERICKNVCEHRFKSEQQKYLEENNGVLNNLFRAKQLDKSIFQGNIDHIPGVLSHLSRNQYCQAEKLKAQREALRPQYSKKKIC